jgi:RimJ/RimL family protein N-acetyltransferase
VKLEDEEMLLRPFGEDRESVLRRYLYIKGQRRDGVIFSLLPEDL